MDATVVVFAPSSTVAGNWRRALERGGFATCEAESRDKWPEACGEGRVLAITSIVDKKDRDRIAALKREHPERALLAIVSAGSSVRAEALEAGADACLPHDADALEIVAGMKALDRRCAQRSGDRAQVEEAQQAHRARDEFLEALAQELRSSLNTIAGWTQILLGPTVDTPMTRRGLEAIERGVQSQTQLVNHLVDVSRGLTGRLHVERQPVALGPVLAAAVESVRSLATTKQIDLVHDPLDDAAATVVADTWRLQQIFRSLLSNAVKFTPPKGRIDVVAKVAAPNVEVRVMDNGMGISGDFLPFVFERFRWTDGALPRPHAGLGLGLTIVRQLVDLHQGTVTADSAGEGQGATFTVALPLVAAATATR